MLAIAALAVSPLIAAARAPRQVTTSVAGSVSGAETSASNSETAIGALPSTAAAATAIATSARVVALQQMVADSGASVGITVVELGGSSPVTWTVGGSAVFVAASTYKLVALMMEAQNIASGATDPNGVVCYLPSDYEAGWFDDYELGACFTRNELAARAARQSDNTAGHMLVRDVGGGDVLNAWAASLGATSSEFFAANTTTADDLAVLWTAEARGGLGGAAAHAWLYPLLTGTTTEQGIPSGIPAGSTVVHKTGAIDAVANDAALVASGPDGPYVLVVTTDGLGGAPAWELIAGISAVVWQAEESRL
jgi:beta-lactamase class A